MVDLAQTVTPPGGGSFQIPKIDFSGFANLPDDYFAGTQAGHTLALQNAFKDGLPKDANGNIDWMAAANRLFPLGDLQGANAMLQTGMSQQGFDIARRAAEQEIQNQGNGAAQPQAPPPSSGNAAAPAGLSLGASINNPGDLRDNAWTKTLPDYVGAKGGFAAFDTPEHGGPAGASHGAAALLRGANEQAHRTRRPDRCADGRIRAFRVRA